MQVWIATRQERRWWKIWMRLDFSKVEDHVHRNVGTYDVVSLRLSL